MLRFRSLRAFSPVPVFKLKDGQQRSDGSQREEHGQTEVIAKRPVSVVQERQTDEKRDEQRFRPAHRHGWAAEELLGFGGRATFFVQTASALVAAKGQNEFDENSNRSDQRTLTKPRLSTGVRGRGNVPASAQTSRGARESGDENNGNKHASKRPWLRFCFFLNFFFL